MAEVRGKIRGLGNVNVGAIEEYKEVKERYDFLKAQVHRRGKEPRAELTRMIAELCSEMEELFTTSFKQINTHFRQIFKELFGGGHRTPVPLRRKQRAGDPASRSRSRPRARSSRT